RAFQPVPAVGALGRGIGSVGSDDYYTEELPYTVTDVADPVLAVDEPVDFEAIEEVPASRGARADERRRAEAVDQFVVAPDEVDEGGDRIIGSGNAEVVADILEADQES
ncbi:MAG: hypothetical protein FWG25_08165, partial [Promicromonosporaceae bacterium]|nr:hypothetical protein [Promicromonosporaceae bacterium]